MLDAAVKAVSARLEHTMSRRRGTGSIFRKPGCATWVIQFYKDGQRIREATGLTDRAAAQRRLTTRLYQIDKNEFAARERRAVRIEELFAALAEHTLNNRPTAAAALGRRWKHLSASFAAMLAANLTTDDIHHYIRQRQEQGAQNATVNRELSALKRMFNLGRQSTPPKVRVVPFIPMLKEDNVRSGFVEDGEFSRLAAEASDLWLRTFLELAYSYGWRKGELLGLRVRQTDLRLRTIRLDVGSTKNGEGREVAMTSKVEELLRQATAGKGPDDFVLTRPDGRPVKDFRKIWRNLCTRADLPTLIVHDREGSARGGCSGKRSDVNWRLENGGYLSPICDCQQRGPTGRYGKTRTVSIQEQPLFRPLFRTNCSPTCVST
jgi:integrase